MKACPYCSEKIQDAAVKCRFCGEWLEESPATTPGRSSSDAPPLSGRETSSRKIGAAIVSGVGGIVVGASTLLPWRTDAFGLSPEAAFGALDQGLYGLLPDALVFGGFIAGLAGYSLFAEASPSQWLSYKTALIIGGVVAILIAFWARETGEGGCPCQGVGVSVLFLGGVILIIGGALVPNQPPEEPAG